MRLLAAALAVVALGAGTACEPEIKPPPIPPAVQWVLKEIFWHAATVDSPGGPPVLHSCAIQVPPGDAGRRALYQTVDPVWNANGWAFWTACVIAAKNIGYALPVVKTTGDANSPGATPTMFFRLDTVPIFGQGSGTYNDFNGSNVAVYRKGYIEGTPPWRNTDPLTWSSGSVGHLDHLR